MFHCFSWCMFSILKNVEHPHRSIWKKWLHFERMLCISTLLFWQKWHCFEKLWCTCNCQFWEIMAWFWNVVVYLHWSILRKNGITLKSCGAPALVNFEKSWHDVEMLWCTSTDQFWEKMALVWKVVVHLHWSILRENGIMLPRVTNFVWWIWLCQNLRVNVQNLLPRFQYCLASGSVYRLRSHHRGHTATCSPQIGSCQLPSLRDVLRSPLRYLLDNIRIKLRWQFFFSSVLSSTIQR